MKGKLIVFEGTDGSGKATQANLIIKKLIENNIPAETIEFPRYGNKSAGPVEQYLNGEYGTSEEVGPYKASIFYAVDRFAASKDIKQKLEEGKIVIANRYVSSNAAHQAGKIKDPSEQIKFWDWLYDLEFNLFEIPKPDLIVLLHVPAEIGQKLVDSKEQRSYTEHKRDIHEADIHHLEHAERAYLKLAERDNWVIIECAPEGTILTIEEIQDLIWKTISPYLNS